MRVSSYASVLPTFIRHLRCDVHDDDDDVLVCGAWWVVVGDGCRVCGDRADWGCAEDGRRGRRGDGYQGDPGLSHG
jgi:hypothetical protein